MHPLPWRGESSKLTFIGDGEGYVASFIPTIELLLRRTLLLQQFYSTLSALSLLKNKCDENLRNLIFVKPTIDLKPILHRNAEQIGIYFKNNLSLNIIIRKETQKISPTKKSKAGSSIQSLAKKTFTPLLVFS